MELKSGVPGGIIFGYHAAQVCADLDPNGVSFPRLRLWWFAI